MAQDQTVRPGVDCPKMTGFFSGFKVEVARIKIWLAGEGKQAVQFRSVGRLLSRGCNQTSLK